MGKIKTFLNVLRSNPKEIPELAVGNLTAMGLLNWMPDEAFLKLRYWAVKQRKLDLKDPKTFNEKLQWLKLHNRKPEYTMMVDKYRVREYIARTIGEEYLIPLLGVWDDPEDIDFDMLPDRFVLKCNHDSGSVILCPDKSCFDAEAAREKLRSSMKKNLFWWGREWPYKDVKPCVIAEKYMVDESGTQLKDYKFFCFYGEAKMIQVDFDRFVEHKRNIYNTKWEMQDLQIQFPRDAKQDIPKPAELDRMIRLAEKLARGIPHVRVDFYVVEGRVYFGELTFFHGSGHERFTPEEWDYKFGEWIDLTQMDR